MAGIVKAPDGRDGGFPITSWTLIREAQGAPSEERARLLNELFERYRQPLWAFFYAKCRSRNGADDLIGQLWERFVHGKLMVEVASSKGRLRHWLKRSAHNLFIDETRKRRQQQLSEQQPPEPLGDDPDEAFMESWRRDVLTRAFADVHVLCKQKGRTRDFHVFRDRYLAGDPYPSWREVAARHGLSEDKASNAGEWVKRQVANAIRAQVGVYAETDDEIDAEIGELLS